MTDNKIIPHENILNHLNYVNIGLEYGVPVQLTAMVEQKAFGGFRLVR
jgi:hypothetical protein